MLRNCAEWTDVDTLNTVISHPRYAPHPKYHAPENKKQIDPSLSSHISIEASHSDSKQSWVRAAQSALLTHASITSDIIVRESVSMSINVCSVHESRVVLESELLASRVGYSKSQRSTHVCHSILVVSCRRNSVRLLARQQQSASVESSGQTWNDSVRLAVGACGERPGRAAEDVTGGWPLECDGVVRIRESVVFDLASYIAVGGLRVDRERLGRVAGPHWSERQ